MKATRFITDLHQAIPEASTDSVPPVIMALRWGGRDASRGSIHLNAVLGAQDSDWVRR